MSEKIKNISFSDQWKIYSNSSIKHFEAINIKGSTIDNFNNNYTFSNQSSLSTILIFGDIVHQLESVLRKVKKNLGNHYCEMTKFDDKIIKRLIEAGHQIQLVDDFDEIMGHAGAIIIDKYGNKEAGFDLRSDGMALGN